MQKVGLKILPDPSSSLYRPIQKMEDPPRQSSNIYDPEEKLRLLFGSQIIVAVGFLAAQLPWCQSGNQPLSDLGHGTSGIHIAVFQSCPSKATWWLSTLPPGLSELSVETCCWCPIPAACGLVFTPIPPFPAAESRMVFLELLFVVVPAVWTKCQCLASQLHTVGFSSALLYFILIYIWHKSLEPIQCRLCSLADVTC